MSMTINRQELETAALLLFVDEEGRYKWSSSRTAEEVAKELHAIADDIEANETDDETL